MKNLTTYLAVAAAALVTGGLVATSVTPTAETAKPTAMKTPIAPAPEQVRTQVVTRVIHRVRKVHLHPKRRHVTVPAAPAAPAPAPVVRAAPAPAPAVVPRRVAVAQSTPQTNSAPAPERKPTLETRSSGGGSGSRSNDDDGNEVERHGDDNEDGYEGGDD